MLFSTFSSLYPWISFHSETAEHPLAPVRTLAEELQARGYATGLFYSSDLDYQGAGQFLRAHGFDQVEDYHARPERPPPASGRS